MSKDRKQELERLSEELLNENDWEDDREDDEEPEYEEDWDEDFDDDEEIFDDEPAYLSGVCVRAYNSDHTDTDLDELSDEVYYAPKSRLTGLLIAAGICAMAVCLALVLLLLRHYGIL